MLFRLLRLTDFDGVARAMDGRGCLIRLLTRPYRRDSTVGSCASFERSSIASSTVVSADNQSTCALLSALPHDLYFHIVSEVVLHSADVMGA
jgi:hypothetical protein